MAIRETNSSPTGPRIKGLRVKVRRAKRLPRSLDCGGGAAALALVLVACTGTSASPRVMPGFTLETIANVTRAREIAALPNGDLIVGTEGSDIYIVAGAEDLPAAPHVFATLDDEQAAGVAFTRERGEIYVATTHHVWSIPYRGESHAQQIRRIGDVRAGTIAPGTDGDVHNSTSVGYADGNVYVAAGSSCNATMDDGRNPCTEVDPTRAAVSVMQPDGSHFTRRATRIRNAISLAVNPQTGSVWVGDAGQDDLPFGHPYEFLDDLSAHAGVADYGWPQCEEDRHAYRQGSDCSKTVEPLVVLPAYSTIVGAAFYPLGQSGAYAFPARFRGGLFAAAHGSWHKDDWGCNAAPPRVVFIDMNGDRPVKPVDWQNPTTQWADFVTGFQTGCTTRIGRPTGIAVGPKGSLFVADDLSGRIYRIRPAPPTPR